MEPTPSHKMPRCLVEQKVHFWTECHLNNFNLTTLIFLVGLIYRWGKGAKSKNNQKQAKIYKKHVKIVM